MPGTCGAAVKRREVQHTNLIQLENESLGAAGAQQVLGLRAVWAVGLAEDGDGVLLDPLLDLGFDVGHFGEGGGAREEAAEDGGNFGGLGSGGLLDDGRGGGKDGMGW
jgi:hypothetical protein